MKNVVTLENPKLRLVRLSTIVLLIFAAIFIVTLFIFRAVNTKNLNGDVREVTGIVSEISGENGTQIVLADGGIYNATMCTTLYHCDLNQLVGKSVVLYTPETQFGNGLPTVLGIVADGETLIDYNETIAIERSNNSTGIIVCGILAGIVGLTAFALLIWRLYIPQTKEFTLAEKYSEYSMERQPHCPEYKILPISLLVGMLVVMAMSIVDVIVCSIVDSDLVALILSIVNIFVVTAYAVTIFPLRKWIVKKEMAFYAQNLPFDFADVSHIRMRKSFKQQLQQMVQSERTLYPHRYGDGGNGYEIDFTLHGVDFFAIYDDEYEENQTEPTAENVFGLEGHKRQPRFTLTYQQLNFEAIAIYRKYFHPMTVVIKSRLTQECDIPKEMVNDVHIILDINLLHTLREFSVEVENLDYLLENKERLMKENCPKQRNRQY